MPSKSPHDSRIRFAVISDPHAVAGDTYRHETYARLETADDPRRNPLAAVRHLIEASKESGSGEPLKADAVLCPGDLAHRMDRNGLCYAWKELGAIADLLGTQRVIATAGNHDVIRGEDLPPGAPPGTWTAALRSLAPSFPTTHADDSSPYFIDDFVITEGDRWRVVTLNSCASHSKPHQHWHGRIDEMTLSHLSQRMAQDRKDVNILMCHHHPVEWTHLSQQDTSHMHGGDALLRSLEQDDPARWLLLHGHRHVPALGYSGDTVSGPVRMSAGSVAVSLHQKGRSDVRNQFYMLDFDLAEIYDLNLVGAGRVFAWDWNLEYGMIQSDPAAALPAAGGFGFRRDAHALAVMCRQSAERLKRRSVTWAELVEDDRRWAYVVPRDLFLLRTVLERQSAYVEPLSGGSQIERVSFSA